MIARSYLQGATTVITLYAMALENRNLHEPRLKGCSTLARDRSGVRDFRPCRKLPKLPKSRQRPTRRRTTYKEFAENINESVCPPFSLKFDSLKSFENEITNLYVKQKTLESRSRSSTRFSDAFLHGSLHRVIAKTFIFRLRFLSRY